MNQNLSENFHEDEIAMMYSNEINQCSKLDLNRNIEISGYYYNQDDINKIHAHYKDGCIFIGNAELNIPLLVSIIKSSDSVETVYNIQSLHTDKFGEDMLTTWIEINNLIHLLINVDLAKNLLETLKEWKEKGVTEIYLSWYELPK